MRKVMDLRTFSKNEEIRYIFVPNLFQESSEYFKNIQRNINKYLDMCIQKLNMLIPDRQIPFIKVNFCSKDDDGNLRILILDGHDGKFNKIANFDNKSHVLYASISPGQCQILIGSDPVEANATLIIDEEYLVCVCADIFLDIAMFNSYSFLKSLPDSCKKEFSYKKYEYFKKEGIGSYYHFKEYSDEAPTYFSLAFSVRQDKTELELEQYIYIWEDFLNKYYPGNFNQVGSIIEQLKFHKSFYQITKIESPDRIVNRFNSTGGKLLLRINRRPKKRKDQRNIANYFGIPKFRCGRLKVRDIAEYYNPMITRYLREGYISAFKVVVTEENISEKYKIECTIED